MGPKILTVDDSKTVRLIVKRAFKSFACEVLEAGDGVEGLTMAQRHRPDIIVLDLTMPVMDGAEMLARLKADPNLRAIPVVMLTAEAGRDSVMRIAKLGVRDYLIKPFKENLIIERVGRIIDLKTKAEPTVLNKRFEDPLKLLVVDDKPAILDQIRGCLSSTPWTIQGVAQPGAAVDACMLELPDAILISLSLPDSSGFTLYEMLRSNKATKSIAILALSVKTAAEEQTRAQQLGFGAIVTKPIDAADLQAKITRVLNLDTSQRYFQRREGVLVLSMPQVFSQTVAHEIAKHLRTKVSEAVDAGLNRLIIDMSQLKVWNAAPIEFGQSVLQLCGELNMLWSLIGSEFVRQECKNYEETKNWPFNATFEEALAALNNKAPAVPAA
jgi:two-component system cell cycle response regulator